jgi:hypothetical protein
VLQASPAVAALREAGYGRFCCKSQRAGAWGTLGIQPVALLVRTTADIERDLESFAGQPNSGLMLTNDSFTSLRQTLIVDLAGRYRLPSISPIPNFAKEGGLIT